MMERVRDRAMKYLGCVWTILRILLQRIGRHFQGMGLFWRVLAVG